MTFDTRCAAFQERIEAVKWFKPENGLKNSTIEEKAKFVMKCFGIEASVEIRSLKTAEDWDDAWDAALDDAWYAALVAARDAARDAAWGAARDAALDAARVAARVAARDAARDAAWGAARDAAWGAARDAALDAARVAARVATETVAQDLEGFKSKYPNGAFVPLFELWEMGLYPIGVTSGKFVIYRPE